MPREAPLHQRVYGACNKSMKAESSLFTSLSLSLPKKKGKEESLSASTFQSADKWWSYRSRSTAQLPPLHRHHYHLPPGCTYRQLALRFVLTFSLVLLTPLKACMIFNESRKKKKTEGERVE